jgi:DNA integrity scanning protein DisA with diadenylate cyclase activity
VLTPELKVEGFGAVIKSKDLPDYIFTSKYSRVNEEALTQVNPNDFGTRHRSMFSYCWKNVGSLGFVVSQDGDIRAIMRVDNKLIMWENIKVQQFIKSHKLYNPLKNK